MAQRNEIAEDMADALARQFHETYERLAPSHGYETRKESAKPWEEVPDQNKGLMRDVMSNLFTVTVHGTPHWDPVDA